MKFVEEDVSQSAASLCDELFELISMSSNNAAASRTGMDWYGGECQTPSSHSGTAKVSTEAAALRQTALRCVARKALANFS
jgi:hypothetical protein